MLDRLYICIKNPFSLRDLDRFGIEELEKRFDVRILDCTEWLMPAALARHGGASLDRRNLRRIASLSDLRSELGGHPGGLAIDYVGQFSLKAILLFHTLKSRRVSLVVIDSGSHPNPKIVSVPQSIFRRASNFFRKGALLRRIEAQCIKLLLWILPDQKPDVALVAGESWKTNPRFRSATRKVPAHSFDYETYRRVHRLPLFLNGIYALYIDENISGHEDNTELGLGDPATAEKFFPAFNTFMDRFEQVTGMPVVIAAYPSSSPDQCSHFGNRQVYFNRTAELIRNAKLVFTHASTAASFIVLWRKPAVFLTSREIISSWYQPSIEAKQKVLRAPLFNIDEPPNDEFFEGCWNTNESAYIGYERMYIKSGGAPELSLWEILERFGRPGSIFTP